MNIYEIIELNCVVYLDLETSDYCKNNIFCGLKKKGHKILLTNAKYNINFTRLVLVVKIYDSKD